MKGEAVKLTAVRARYEPQTARKIAGKPLQPSSLFLTVENQPLWLDSIYRGCSAFLVASGPSFANLNHSLLRQPGILTMGVNNSVKTFRPNLWASVDDPDHFIRSIWLDPTILKFVPEYNRDKSIFNSDEWRFMGRRVKDCPNVVFYKCNEHFQPSQYLVEDSVNWGNNSRDYGGGRSVMLAALRILFVLGVRRVYLLGVDFRMDAARKYHFEQDRSEGSIANNTATYKKLNEWLAELRPAFDEQNFHVFNCNRESNLKAFDFVSFEEALRAVRAEFDHVDVKEERTRGMYESTVGQKQEGIGR